ncbi:serine hydrolase domain-containing protein [Shewanella algae]|uniref:serine hydrolase domain-containing protein n=1 Tax=Shewanella algae TaxID=38313 RepID=UPI0004683369|nr:serine hydrolase domain-containing protein [Shewanella algae]NKZ41751.1 beta-lactamase family protein [Shewanella algae]QTE77238.1 beta-lactamase family protein [Shewanella algae]QTE94145.1 beta-lactamase family protein [Shewanella algae]
MFNRVLSRVCLGAGPFGDKVAVSAKGFWAYLPIHAFILVSVSLLSACNSDSQEVVLNPVDTAKMQQKVEQLAKEMLVPGAVVILRTPRGDFKTAYGVTRYGGSEATDFDQHVRVGSNTKTWVGTVILQMAQQGRLQLSDTVSMYLDNVPNGESITIEHLLTMRSGLFNYSTTLELNQTLDEQPTKVWTQTELLAMSFAHKPGFAPGSAFEYSNTNTVLLGLIAEQIDGKPLAAVMQQRLFAPLGLERTLFPDIHSNTLPAPLARGYMYGTNVLTMDPPFKLPEKMQREAREGVLAPIDQTEANPSWGWAAGAGISSANELATWVEALVAGELLDADWQRRRLDSVRPIDPDNPNTAYYGLGIAKFGSLYGHTGELPGYNSFMGHDPVNKVTLVVWTNLAPAVDGKDPATTIAAALINMLYIPSS